MRIKLFVRDINSEFPKKVLREKICRESDESKIFTSQGSSYWGGEWTGQYYYPPRRINDIQSRIGEWLYRDEYNNHYVFFDPSTNAVYEGDHDFLKIVQLVKRGLDINKAFSLLGFSSDQAKEVLKHI